MTEQFDEVVARVGDQVIRVTDVDARVAVRRNSPAGAWLAAPGTPEAERFRRWVADALVTEALLAQEADLAGVDGADPRARRAALFAQVTADVRVPADAVRTYHRANPDRFVRPERRRVRHVLVATEEEATTHREAIEAGADLAEVAAAWSLDDGSRRRGGDLGLLRRAELAGPLGDAVFAARPDDLLGPVHTGFGWHVARVEGIAPAGPVPVREVAAAIERDLLAVARRDAFDRWLAARRRARVHLAPQWRHPGDPRSPFHTHRH